MIKDILIPCDCRIGLANGTSIGLDLAKDFGASVTGLGLIPLLPVAGLIPTAVDNKVISPLLINRYQQEMTTIRQRATRTEAYFSELADTGQIAFQWEQHEDTVSQLAELVTELARLSDLTVVDQVASETSEGWADIIEQIILKSGRPTLIVPDEIPRTEIGARTVIAWNNSPTASRAVHDAIPLLKKSDMVRIVTVINGKDSTELNGKDSTDAKNKRASILTDHLKHHDIEATTQEIKSPGSPINTILLEHSADAGADLLVIGGYGKSRLHETILGSLTRKLISESPIPLLVSN